MQIARTKGTSVLGKAESLTGLLEMLLAGDTHEVGDRFPSAQKLAKSYSVSIGTARKAMRDLVQAGYLRAERGAGHFVSTRPPMPQDWIDGAKSRGLSGRKKFLVVLDEEFLGPKHQRLLSRYLHGIITACDTTSLDLELIRNDSDKIHDRLSRGDVQGLLGYYLQKPLSFDSSTVPLLAFGHFEIAPQQISVVADVEAGAYEAFRHLFSLGHEKVIMPVVDLPGFLQERGGNEYLLGMRKAFGEYGVAWSRDLIIPVSEEEILPGADFVRSHVAAGITGMFLPEWSGVLGVYRQSLSAKIKIGRDLSVVAFGNHPWADLLEPEITRIAWDPALHGQRAVSLAKEIAENPKRRDGESVIRMPVHLAVGKSCGNLLIGEDQHTTGGRPSENDDMANSDGINS
jgi:DNA-binding LacI/PurR family transcriptional regulator